MNAATRHRHDANETRPLRQLPAGLRRSSRLLPEPTPGLPRRGDRLRAIRPGQARARCVHRGTRTPLRNLGSAAPGEPHLADVPRAAAPPLPTRQGNVTGHDSEQDPER